MKQDHVGFCEMEVGRDWISIRGIEAAKDHQLEVEAVFDNEDASRRRVIEQLKKDMLVCGRKSLGDDLILINQGSDGYNLNYGDGYRCGWS